MENINLGVFPSLVHDDEKDGKVIKFKYSVDGSRLATLV